MTYQVNSIPSTSSIYYKESGAIWRLSSIFLEHIPFHHPNLVFCCIGTDRSTGDAMGPMTGSFLTQLSSFPFEIVGTLDTPLHALNLKQTVEELYNSAEKPYIIAIDACLGNASSIGDIIVHPGPLYPGKAVKKELPPIGEVSIKGVVNIGGYMEYNVLQSTRLHLTFEMGKVISRALLLAYHRYYLKHRNKPYTHSESQQAWQ